MYEYMYVAIYKYFATLILKYMPYIYINLPWVREEDGGSSSEVNCRRSTIRIGNW